MRAAEPGELAHFDQGLNAILLLSYVALRQGDSVSVGTFGTGAERLSQWFGPAKGVGEINQVLNLLYDLEPSTETPDYTAAATEVLNRHRRRSLVVIVTNVRGEDDEELMPAVMLLGRRHLVLVVSLRERAVAALRDSDISTLEEAVRSAAAHRFERDRQNLVHRLRGRGAMVLDVEPNRLSAEVVNAYLDIKARGAL